MPRINTRTFADRQRILAENQQNRDSANIAEREVQGVLEQQRQQQDRPGIVIQRQTASEKKAGVDAPYYEGVRDASGNLIDQYKTDPYSGEATQKLKEEAFSTGESPWAKMQGEKQAFEETQARGQSTKQAAQAQAMAQAQMMRQGGMGGGSRALLASRGAKDLLMANQAVSGQGTAQRLGIQQQDQARKQGLMGDFAQAEAGAQASNIGQMKSDVERRALFEGNRYNQQMSAWAAKQSADATRAAGGGGGKK